MRSSRPKAFLSIASVEPMLSEVPIQSNVSIMSVQSIAHALLFVLGSTAPYILDSLDEAAAVH